MGFPFIECLNRVQGGLILFGQDRKKASQIVFQQFMKLFCVSLRISIPYYKLKRIEMV